MEKNERNEKENLSVILEDINSKFSIIQEGHIAIQAGQDEMRGDINNLRGDFENFRKETNSNLKTVLTICQKLTMNYS